MKLDDLINQKMILTIAEPWDFTEEVGCGPFSVTVTNVYYDTRPPNEAILIRLDSPIHFQDEEVKYFMASTRYVGQELEDIEKLNTIIVNLRPILTKAAESGLAQQAAWNWKGWDATGSVKLPEYRLGDDS